MQDLTLSLDSGDYGALKPFVRDAMRANETDAAVEVLKPYMFKPVLRETLSGTREGVAVLYELDAARHWALRRMARTVWDAALGAKSADCPDRHEQVMVAPFYLSQVSVKYDVCDLPIGRLMVAVQSTHPRPRVVVICHFNDRRSAKATRTRLVNAILPKHVKVKVKENPYDLTQGGWNTRAVHFSLELSGEDEATLEQGLVNIGEHVLRPIIGFWRFLEVANGRRR